MTEELPNMKKLLRDRGICVLIPTYNNAATLGAVVSDVLNYCDDVIVVNDGSTDNTAEILGTFQTIAVVGYPENKGKGYALKKGFLKARELGFSYAITLDSDGQHYAKDIEAFLGANMEYPGSLIVGERRLEGADRSKGSSFANKFSNFWFAVQTFRRLKDTQTGYRLYPLKKLRGLSLLTNRYEAELELLVFAAWHGVRIESVPVDVYYPPKEERVSHFRPGRDFARISLLNTVLCLFALVYGLPLAIWRLTMTAVRTVYSLLVFSIASFLFAAPSSALYFLFVRSEEKRRTFIHNLIYRFFRFAVFVHGIPGTKFSSNIKNPLSFDKAQVVISNHQSHLDLVYLLAMDPKMICLTNEWAWKNPFYGFLIRKAEFVPMTEGLDSVMPKLRQLAADGYSIVVFPEGTRSADCRIARFHKGAFHIAEELGLDILPVFLYGPGKILKKNTFYLQKGQVYLETGDVLARAELESMGSTMKQSIAVTRMYREHYDTIKNRIEQDA